MFGAEIDPCLNLESEDLGLDSLWETLIFAPFF